VDKTTKALVRLVDQKGAPAVADMLGHDSTQRVQRWVRNEEIPKSHVGMVGKILIERGVK